MLIGLFKLGDLVVDLCLVVVAILLLLQLSLRSTTTHVRAASTETSVDVIRRLLSVAARWLARGGGHWQARRARNFILANFGALSIN